MKNISLIGKFRYLGGILVVMQGILFVLLAIFFMDRQYVDTWQRYLNQAESTTVYISKTSPEKKADISGYLGTTVGEQSLFIARKESLTGDKGEVKSFKIGVDGNVEENYVTLEFMGQDILNKEKLNMLLNSQNQESTLGVDLGSIHSLGDIPYFRFYQPVVVKKLSKLIEDSGTVNGTYHIRGLDSESQKEEFILGLSQASGISKEDLLTKDGGEILDDGFNRDILLVFLMAQVFLNSIFFLVLAVKSLQKQGRLALLGWSRKSFIWKVFGGFFLTSMGVIPVLIPVGYMLAGWNQFSFMLISYFALALLMNVIIVSVELALAAVVIMSTKSLDAIHGRIPKKILYIFGVFAYLLVSGGIMFCGIYVDGPVKSLADNVRLSKKWDRVSDYQILSDVSAGEDSATISGQSNELNQDIYDWYSSIAEEKGVYLVNTSYTDRSILEQWEANQVYSTVPTQPFWEFKVSPNYLPNLGIELSEEIIREAKEGIRLYLIPDTLSETEQARMEGWARESASGAIGEGDIQTQFVKEQKFNFVKYIPTGGLFTWATDSKEDIEVLDPIIYVSTPENMRFFESESLRATGTKNGYIKFLDEETKEKHTKSNLFDKYNLSDNNMKFVEVQRYIDGLQKEIGLTLLWFGMTFLLLLIVLVGLLLTLATIFRVANQEKINIKKFLGFGFYQMYGVPTVLLSGVILLELAIMFIFRSKFGLLLMSVVSAIQIVIFVKYMMNSELKKLLSSLKGE